jgi:hypothetical protein
VELLEPNELVSIVPCREGIGIFFGFMCPYPAFPRMRATTIEAISINPRETTAPERDQKAPLAMRLSMSDWLILSHILCRDTGRIEYIYEIKLFK